MFTLGHLRTISEWGTAVGIGGEDFDRLCGDYIGEGFIPYGEMKVVVKGDDLMFFQTFIKIKGL